MEHRLTIQVTRRFVSVMTNLLSGTFWMVVSFLFFGTVSALISGLMAHAAQEVSVPVKEAPCGILKKFGGEVEILNPNRTRLITTRLKAGIPCGGWVTVRKGWAEIHHRQGYRVNLSNNTFVELFDNVKDRHLTGQDHIVLYKGKVYGKVEKGQGELRVVTANGLVRIPEGEAIVIFSQINEETQVLGINRKISFENRFEGSRRITVKRGEATSLNLRAKRVVPSTPQAISLSSMRTHLADFNLEKKEAQKILTAAKKRRFRKMPHLFIKGDPDSSENRKRFAEKPKKKPFPGRNPNKKDYTYERHPPLKGDQAAKDRWVDRIVGNSNSVKGTEVYGVDRKIAHARPKKLKIIDPASQMKRKKKKEQDAEKVRIMNELSEMEFDESLLD